jgi:hypothetical protein
MNVTDLIEYLSEIGAKVSVLLYYQFNSSGNNMHGSSKKEFSSSS